MDKAEERGVILGTERCLRRLADVLVREETPVPTADRPFLRTFVITLDGRDRAYEVVVHVDPVPDWELTHGQG